MATKRKNKKKIKKDKSVIWGCTSNSGLLTFLKWLLYVLCPGFIIAFIPSYSETIPMWNILKSTSVLYLFFIYFINIFKGAYREKGMKDFIFILTNFSLLLCDFSCCKISKNKLIIWGAIMPIPHFALAHHSDKQQQQTKNTQHYVLFLWVWNYFYQNRLEMVIKTWRQMPREEHLTLRLYIEFSVTTFIHFCMTVIPIHNTEYDI